MVFMVLASPSLMRSATWPDPQSTREAARMALLVRFLPSGAFRKKAWARMAVSFLRILRSMRPTGIDSWPTVWIISLECLRCQRQSWKREKNPHSKQGMPYSRAFCSRGLPFSNTSRGARRPLSRMARAMPRAWASSRAARRRARFAAHWSSGAADLPRRQIMATRMALPRGCYFLSTPEKANCPRQRAKRQCRAPGSCAGALPPP